MLKWPEGKRPVFIGAGHTPYRRYSGTHTARNVAEAAAMAIEDAGIKVEDIDGLACWPNLSWQGQAVPGHNLLNVQVTSKALNLPNVRWWCQNDGPPAGNVGPVQAAAAALGAGYCNYVLLFRTGHHPAGVRYRQVSARTAGGNGQFTTVYGHGVGGAGQALTYQAYLDRFGATREEMATYVLNANRNAQLNPYSVWKGREITFEDYMNARLIAYPMNVFDNDMPVDGVGCVLMTTEDRAKDTPHPGGYIAGVAISNYNKLKTGTHNSLDAEYEMNMPVGKNLYENSGLGPEDVDLIHVYDGFSPMVWMWLEAFQFCKVGEAHEWIQNGRIALEGSNPLNTSGGNLGNGRIHGFTHVIETAQQMMGTAGERQLPRPVGQLKKLDVALCESGPFFGGSAFICTRE